MRVITTELVHKAWAQSERVHRPTTLIDRDRLYVDAAHGGCPPMSADSHSGKIAVTGRGLRIRRLLLRRRFMGIRMIFNPHGMPRPRNDS